MILKSRKALVIGAEGTIGRSLYDCLASDYEIVYGTTKRKKNRNNFFKIDLINSFDGLNKIASKCDVAFVCAGTTKAFDCEKNKAESYAINVTNTFKLVKILKNLEVFVVWLSSNAVFSGKRPFSGSDEPYKPLTEYGRQKVKAEQKIIKLGGVAIVRLTKVLSKNTPLISDWIEKLKAGKEIYPFSDAYFSPISLKYATNAIAKVGSNMRTGIFNISGNDDISYYDFARILAIKLHGVDDLVRPVSKVITNSKIFASGRYSTLDMEKIMTITDIKPQPFENVLEDLL